MGSKAYGIFIKTDIDKYNPDQIAKDLFGCIDVYNPLESHLKFGEYLTIMTHENGIEILEPNFGERFVKKDGPEVKKINKYFDSPEFIFAYMFVTGVYAYGFRYMERGELVRYRYHDWDGRVEEQGTPLAEELKYLNAKYFMEEEADGEQVLVYSLDPNEHKVDGAYSDITPAVTEDIMVNRLGYTYDGHVMGENVCLELKQYKLRK